MKLKILNLLLIIASLSGYLKWGKNNSLFLFEAEREILMQLLSGSKSAIHPFTLIPLLGQFLLFITLFQNRPSRGLTYTGIGCLSLLLLFMFFIGILAKDLKILVSTLPFIILAILTITAFRKDRKSLSANG